MQTKESIRKLHKAWRVPKIYCNPPGWIDFVPGLLWGDEAKSRVVFDLSVDYDIVARFNGGPNAGHTVVYEKDGQKIECVFHQMPAGILRERVKVFLGNGMVINPVILQKEIDDLIEQGIDIKGRIFISQNAHIITPTNRMLDAAEEWASGGRIGSTQMGITPTYLRKIGRKGLRFGDYKYLREDFNERYQKSKSEDIEKAKSLKFDVDNYTIEKMSLADYETLWFESLEKIFQEAEIVNVEWINNQIADGARVLGEGAQGGMLDIDFGTYPFVTSSNATTGGLLTGLGVRTSYIRKVIGVTKATYVTRVGKGPFPTRMKDDGEYGEKLQQNGFEFGRTTGRPRDTGPLDLVALRYTVMINGVTELFLTKIDVMDGGDYKKLKICVGYEVNGEVVYEMPYEAYSRDVIPVYIEIPWCERAVLEDGTLAPEAITLCELIEEYTGVPVKYISYSPKSGDFIRLWYYTNKKEESINSSFFTIIKNQHNHLKFMIYISIYIFI